MIGGVQERPDGTRMMEVKYTYDERVEDGMYAAISMQIIKEGVENPEKLL